MNAEVVLNIAEFFDLLLAELTLEDVLEPACLVVDSESLDVVLCKLLRGVVCSHLVLVWVSEILILFHDVTYVFLGFFIVAGCIVIRALQLGCMGSVVNN